MASYTPYPRNLQRLRGYSYSIAQGIWYNGTIVQHFLHTHPYPRITKKRMSIVKKTQRNNLFHDFSGLSQYYLLLLHRTN